MDAPKHKVVVIAGPAGSGKDSIVRGLLTQIPHATLMVTATTRTKRPGEEHGVNYYYFSNDEFLKEVSDGNIPEHYHRKATDTYYGTYKPDIDKRLSTGDLVFAVVQIVGAKYLKEHYGALTMFVEPGALDAFEKRIRERSPMSDTEWQERLRITEEEVREHAPWYDYRIKNEDGKLEEAIQSVMDILKKEKYL